MPTGPDPRSDRALLTAHLGGEPCAFDEIVRRHEDRLWAFAIRTLGDSHEAQDALQDAMLSAFRGAAGWRGEASVSTWLRRIVYHACLDRARRRRVHRAGRLDDEDDVPLPRDPMADRMTALAVDDALGALPFAQRAAVVLVDMEGLTIQEAATVLEIKVGTVKSRAARGRYRLAVLLGHLRPGVDDDMLDGEVGGTGDGNGGNPQAAGGVQVQGGDVSSRTGGQR